MRKVPLGRNGTTVFRPYFGTLIYTVAVPPAVRVVLQNAGLYAGNLGYGDWSLIGKHSIDTAVGAYREDAALVDRCFPYPWDMPIGRPFEAKSGDVALGTDGREWEVKLVSKKGGLSWVRVT
jgi:hypothetical protein